MEVFPRSDLLPIPAAVTEDETVQYPEAVALGVAPGLRPRRREVIPVRKRVCPFLVREDPRMRGSGENRMPEPRAVACCQALPSVTRSLLEGGRERNLDQGLAAEPLDNCGFEAAVGQDVARLILQLRERPNAPRGNEPLRGGEAVDALLGTDVDAGAIFDVDAGLGDDVRHCGLLYWRGQLLDELRCALLERVLDDDLIEAGRVGAAQSGGVRVPAEAEDRNVGIRVRNLFGIDARDVGDHE